MILSILANTGVENSSQVRRPGLENLNLGLAVFPWKKPVWHAFNKIKTPLLSKRLVFNSNHMQVFVNRLLSL